MVKAALALPASTENDPPVKMTLQHDLLGYCTTQLHDHA
jgi:hypothetical protein